jgi:hypothetical protein
MDTALEEAQRLAMRRAAAAACGTASPLQAMAAAPLWRALSDESAAWLLTQARLSERARRASDG